MLLCHHGRSLPIKVHTRCILPTILPCTSVQARGILRRLYCPYITSFLFKSVSNNLSTHTLHLASSLPLHCLIYQFTPAQLASQPPSPNLLQSWSSIFTSPPSKLTNNVEIRTRYARDLCSAISYRPTPDLWVGSDCDMTSKIIHLSYIRVKISVLQRQLRFGKNRIV